MGRRTALAVAGWLAAAAAATLTGLGAVQIIGEGITGTAAATLSEEQVADALASPAPAPPVPTATPTPVPTGSTGPRRTFTTEGGTVTAQCDADLVTLVSWAPAQGFRVTDHDRGPDDDAEVKFATGNREVEVHVVCAAGHPTLTTDDDDEP
jgi:hypothetical protein